MKRNEYRSGKLTLSYLDAGGDASVLIALHAHWMEAGTYVPLAAALAPHWRLVAPDQRGHGHSSHAATYSREDYLSDLDALFAHLSITSPVVLLGNSLGAANAYQFAARRPELVRGLVVEDMGVVTAVELAFIRHGPVSTPLGPPSRRRSDQEWHPIWNLLFRQVAAGWTLAFDPHDIVKSQTALNGDHTPDWQASDCPALVVRGMHSQVTKAAELARMVELRPNTRLVELDAGHVVHTDNPVGYIAAAREFLGTL
jgi:esterase